MAKSHNFTDNDDDEIFQEQHDKFYLKLVTSVEGKLRREFEGRN